ncbi:MAG TPA: hypothetical protein RMH99_30730 [Sandaracinaceae bacterium LLY-WYZ-13_1]|nr:hypothetical protein [Sandaracinaceae bacterium LLY-WYZ-13_1]
MPPRKTKDAERVRFIAPPGSSKLYAEVAALEGLDKDAWIRSTLHDEATRVLEAHGEDTSRMPPRHLKRPPRLQPRMLVPPPDDDGNSA